MLHSWDAALAQHLHLFSPMHRQHICMHLHERVCLYFTVWTLNPLAAYLSSHSHMRLHDVSNAALLLRKTAAWVMQPQSASAEHVLSSTCINVYPFKTSCKVGSPKNTCKMTIICHCHCLCFGCSSLKLTLVSPGTSCCRAIISMLHKSACTAPQLESILHELTSNAAPLA